jgi:hypothetical protein
MKVTFIAEQQKNETVMAAYPIVLVHGVDPPQQLRVIM